MIESAIDKACELLKIAVRTHYPAKRLKRLHRARRSFVLRSKGMTKGQREKCLRKNSVNRLLCMIQLRSLHAQFYLILSQPIKPINFPKGAVISKSDSSNNFDREILTKNP